VKNWIPEARIAAMESEITLRHRRDTDNQPTLYAEVEGIFIAEEDSLQG
jgi:hypothetical protein